jgi:hypothetical protein
MKKICCMFTVATSQPVSAFLFFASDNVEARMALSLSVSGGGGRPGVRKVSKCWTVGGRRMFYMNCTTSDALKLQGLIGSAVRSKVGPKISQTTYESRL